MAEPLSDDVSSAGAPNEGWRRLQLFYEYIFSKHTPGEQLPPAPEELKEWAQDTLVTAFAGMLLGGGLQWYQERQAGPVQPPSGAPTKAHIARAMAEEQTQRLARVCNSTLTGGLRVGGIAAVFYMVQLLSGIYRNKRDFHDAAYAGAAAGAVLGLALKGGSRVRSSVLGAGLGASIGAPTGLLQDKLIQWMPEEARERRLSRYAHTQDILSGRASSVPEQPPSHDFDVTAAVIAQLEASLSTSQARQLREQPQQESSYSSSSTRYSGMQPEAQAHGEVERDAGAGGGGRHESELAQHGQQRWGWWPWRQRRVVEHVFEGEGGGVVGRGGMHSIPQLSSRTEDETEGGLR